MAQYFEFKFMGETYTARCESRNTRSGFAHDCDVHDSNYHDCATASCYYLNRTWECFRYESVLHEVIYKMAAEKADSVVENWKRENKKSRIMKAQRDNLINPIWAEYEKAKSTIKAL